MRNLLATVPRGHAEMVAATVRTIFAQPDEESTRTQLRHVADTLRDRFATAAELLDDAEADLCAYATFPRAHWTKLWSTNPFERLHREIKRRTDVVGIFPDDRWSSPAFPDKTSNGTSNGRSVTGTYPQASGDKAAR